MLIVFVVVWSSLQEPASKYSSSMVDPITILVAGAVWSLLKAVHETCKAIAEWFARIKQYRLANIFKELQALMDKYNSQRFLSTTGKKLCPQFLRLPVINICGCWLLTQYIDRDKWLRTLDRAHKAGYKGELKSGGQTRLLEKAEAMEDEMSEALEKWT